MNILIKFKNHLTRSGSVGRAWTEAILYSEEDRLVFEEDEAELVIIYGCGPGNRAHYMRARERGLPTITIDLGFWKRGSPKDNNAHYKVSVNWHHPQHYLMKMNCPSDRFKKFNKGSKEPLPWYNTGKQILLAGMGPKSFELYDMKSQEWDLLAFEEIRKRTDRPIVYRPKPSWYNPPPILGTTFSDKHQNLDTLLLNTYLVVTHHSNVAVDGLMVGIPAICPDGAANAICTDDFDTIDEIEYPNRKQFFWNLAYCNWSIEEMQSGECWRYIKEHVLPIV